MPDRIPGLKDWVGGSQEAADLVLTERCVALAAALGEPTVDLQDGGVLPPLRHWLYFWDIVDRDRLGRDGHPALGRFPPAIGAPRGGSATRSMGAGDRKSAEAGKSG